MIDPRKDTNQTAQIKHLLICVRVKENRIQALEDELALLKGEREVEARQVTRDRRKMAEFMEKKQTHDPWDLTTQPKPAKRWWHVWGPK